MNRRAFLFAAVATSAIPVVARAASDLTVVYIGGLDCPPCTKWKQQHKGNWLASAEYQRVTWVEIDPPKLREAYREHHWPAELKLVLYQLPRKTGTPRFLIVRGGTVVSNEVGRSKWTVIRAHLKTMLG